MLLASPASAPVLPAAEVPGAVLELARCPLCKKALERGRFAGKSDVVVDLCDRHGLWLDAGELARILAFVAQAARPAAPNVDAAQATLEANARMGDAHLRAARLELAATPESPRGAGGLGVGAALVVALVVLSALGYGAYARFFAHHGENVKGAAESAEKALGR